MERAESPAGNSHARMGVVRSQLPLEAEGASKLAHSKDCRLKGAPGCWDAEMKYMLLIYLDEQALSETDREKYCHESVQLAQEIHSSGQFLAAAPLYPTSTATSVRVREGKQIVTDGPFAETHEQLGGYFLVYARDLDEAIAIAARIPVARMGIVEIRPVQELAGLPPG